jgi:hypothetical protein
VLALVSLGACSGLPGYGSGAGVPAPTYSDFVGEIQTVDSGRQEIELRTTDGQARVVRYAARRFSTASKSTALEGGDLIAGHTQGTSFRPMWT